MNQQDKVTNKIDLKHFNWLHFLIDLTGSILMSSDLKSLIKRGYNSKDP